MSQSVSFRFTPRKDDYVKSLRAYQRANKQLVRLMILVLALEGLFLLSVLVTGLPDNPTTLLSLLFLPLGFLYIFELAPRQFGRQAEKDERLLAEMSWQVDDEKVRVETRFSESTMDWGTFERAVETKEHYLLIYSGNKRLYQFVPKRAFGSPEEEGVFRELLKRHVKR